MSGAAQRLAPDALARAPADVARPRYDRAKVAPGILHLGLGAFHRAHEAVYTDAVLAEDPRWGIVGVSLQSPDVRDRLQPQGGLYSLLERDVAGTRVAVIGAIGRALYLGEDFSELVRAFADPRTKIVSLTVTEKGYCHDPASRRLLADHPGLAHDYADPTRPQTTIGLLVAGLGIRRLAGGGPVTVLSCDNLPENGRLLAELVREYAGRVEPKMLRWLHENVAFPSTMVDRRAPATTAADYADAEARLGMRDAAAVVCEPFTQWVIEDRFAAGRPAWERAGAELVRDVVPYEAMKLRMLNASHSGLAYLGSLAGFEHTCEVVAVPAFATFARRLMREDAAPTLTLPPGVDAARYEAALLERFANPALKHRCEQIAADGSQKLPQRLLDTARARLAAGAPCEHVALAVAAWMRYVAGVDEQGRRFEVRDPLAARLATIARDQGPDAPTLARSYLAVREVFGDDLPRAPVFADAVGRAFASLCERGARATVESRYGAPG
jgi:fructuronate reductase